MKVLVTGGAGFIGSNLVKRLINEGAHEVTIVDDFSTGFRENIRGLDVEILEGSILDRGLLRQAGHRADAIVHLAARPSVPLSIKEPQLTNEVNVNGTLNVLEVAQDFGSHVTIASSSAVYGDNPTLPLHESECPQPVSPYAVSKLAAEAYGLSYGETYGVPILALRFFNVYGPGQAAGHAYASVIPSFIDSAVNGRALEIHGDGEQTRDFVFVDDVTDVLACAAKGAISSPGVLNLAAGKSYSLLEIVAVIESILGESLVKNHISSRAGDIRDSLADITSLQANFPTFNPFDINEGVERTLEWFQQRLSAV